MVRLFSHLKADQPRCCGFGSLPIEHHMEQKQIVRWKQRFKFENGWLKEEPLESLLKDAWTSRGHLPILEKLQLCSTKLQSWDRNQIGQFKNKIKYHKYIIGVYRAKTTARAAQELSTHKEALSTSLHQQEIFWKQRAKNH